MVFPVTPNRKIIPGEQKERLTDVHEAGIFTGSP
jgi:hypothetical protein